MLVYVFEFMCFSFFILYEFKRRIEGGILGLRLFVFFVFRIGFRKFRRFSCFGRRVCGEGSLVFVRLVDSWSF